VQDLVASTATDGVKSDEGKKMSTLFGLLRDNGENLTDHDVAVLSDWANDMARITPNPGWKRAYSLIREGCDLLLRRRARSTAIEAASYSDQPATSAVVLEVCAKCGRNMQDPNGACSHCGCKKFVPEAVHA
jgi:hypothetical protein